MLLRILLCTLLVIATSKQLSKSTKDVLDASTPGGTAGAWCASTFSMGDEIVMQNDQGRAIRKGDRGTVIAPETASQIRKVNNGKVRVQFKYGKRLVNCGKCIIYAAPIFVPPAIPALLQGHEAMRVVRAIEDCAQNKGDKQKYIAMKDALIDSVKAIRESNAGDDPDPFSVSRGANAWKQYILSGIFSQREFKKFLTPATINGLNDFLDKTTAGQFDPHCPAELQQTISVKGVATTCKGTLKAGNVWLLEETSSKKLLVLKSAGDKEIEEWETLGKGGRSIPQMCTIMAKDNDIVFALKRPEEHGRFIILSYISGEMMSSVINAEEIKWSAGDFKQCMQDVVTAIGFTFDQAGGEPDDNHWDNVLTDKKATDEFRHCSLIDVAPMSGKQPMFIALHKFRAPSSTGHWNFCQVLINLIPEDAAAKLMQKKLFDFFCSQPPKCGDVVKLGNYGACWKAFEDDGVPGSVPMRPLGSIPSGSTKSGGDGAAATKVSTPSHAIPAHLASSTKSGGDGAATTQQ